jgi:hypothetical protein
MDNFRQEGLLNYQRIFVLAIILLGLVLLTGCGGGAAAPTPTSEAAPTSAPAATLTPTSAPTPTPVPEATPTPEPVGEKVQFEFVTPLSTAEQGEDIQNLLHDTEGILSIRGDEFGVTIAYDPEILTADDLRQQMAIIGFPVK